MFVFETGDWRARSRLADIEAGLSALEAEIKRHRIQSIALPPLGCGLGGLEWTEVKPRINRALAGMADLDTLVFEPYGTDAAEALVAKAGSVDRL